VGEIGAEELVEHGGDEVGGALGGLEATVGFRLETPGAEEIVDRGEQILLRWRGGFWWLFLAVEFFEGLGGFQQEPDGGEADVGLRGGCFFGPDFGAADVATTGDFEGTGFDVDGVGGDFDCADKTHPLHGTGDSLASDVVAELRIGGIAASRDPTVYFLDDLGDAGFVEAEFDGDDPLLGTVDLHKLVDFQVALAGDAEIPGFETRTGVWAGRVGSLGRCGERVGSEVLGHGLSFAFWDRFSPCEQIFTLTKKSKRIVGCIESCCRIFCGEGRCGEASAGKCQPGAELGGRGWL
jgi:hypothetical protein